MSTVVSSDKRRESILLREVTQSGEHSQLIWLDENFDNSSDYRRAQSMLLEFNATLQFYSDLEQCSDFMNSIKNERVILIISGESAWRLLEQISTHPIIVAIFVFCTNHQKDQWLINQCKKIIGIYTDQECLKESIRHMITRIEKQTLDFYLFHQKQRIGRNLAKESAAFLWHQMLIYVLKQMPQDEQTKDDMLKICCKYYRHSKKDLQKIEDFRLNYSSDKAIAWYTAECFLYKLLNKALRTENIELLVAFRFFIIDLCAALERESRYLKDQLPLFLYRGIQIRTEELVKLQQNEGEIISMNGFLSTSRNIHVALAFAGQSLPSDDFQAVIFEITADPSLATIAFADIQSKAQIKDEEEVLFNLNAVFKIGSITFNSTTNIWSVKLTATDEGSEKVQAYMIWIKQELDEHTPLIYFGRILLFELGQVDPAKRYYEMLLKSLSYDHADIASIYNSIGHVYRCSCDLNLALKHFELAYEIRRKRLLPDHPHIAGSLYNLGGINIRIGNYDRALKYYQEVLDMDEKNYPGNHHNKAGTIKNIGRVYTYKYDFYNASVNLFRAFDMFKRALPPDHPHIARCLGCIGNMYEKKGEFDRAINYYHQQLNMEEQCWPPDHPNCWANLDAVVNTYKKMNNIKKALDICQEKLNVLKNTLGETHPCISRTLIIMANALSDENPNEAIKHYEQVVSIIQQTTLAEPLLMAKCFTSMSCLYRRQDMLEDALLFELKALDLNRQTLPSDHTHFAKNLRNIGIYYRSMNNRSQALRYFNDSMSIYRAHYGPDHEDVKIVQTDINELNENQV
ncbi:unnamed protein product [Rotaria socialis]|uniref:NAD(P)(+)--arginine ADP-ribosyltransferase n=1 Tax=Rotaria socialis TaxID=392032 RepID=A0A818DL70_9BILA|nr:unnamed protein product [Rotaria socialis]CAF4577901.1 unnamed protein product [Rotaria socialis]